MISNTCKNCFNEFVPQKGLISYCSLACRNTRKPSPDTKQKISKSLQGQKIFRSCKRTIIPKFCKFCGTEFLTKGRLTCSSECLRYLTSENSSKQVRHGRGKSGYYNKIWCDSLYELVFVINNPSAVRYTGSIEYVNSEGKHSKYIPDFVVDEKVYEIKGFLSKNVELKIKAANDLGIDIFLISDTSYFKKEIKRLKELHSVKCLSEIYDEYKPKYIYICKECSEHFKSSSRRKTIDTFCSRKCAGTYRQKKYIMSISESGITRHFDCRIEGSNPSSTTLIKK